MSSPNNSLFGLVNQLHNMETTLTNILMEAALKLTSLTESNVFLLVETSEGRRFVGKDHLCQAYNHGGLFNTGSDLELHLDCDSNLSALKAKPSPTPLSFGSPSRSAPRPLRPPHLPGRKPGRKRKIPAGAEKFAFKTKTSASSSTPAKVAKLGDADAAVFMEDVFSLVDNEVKTELASPPPGVAPHPVDISEAAFAVDPPFAVDATDAGFSVAEDDDEGGRGSPIDDGVHDLSWVDAAFSGGNPKWEFVAAADERTDFSKNCVARKVLDSLLYDLGREAAVRWSGIKRPLYLHAVFHRWCLLMPNLHRLERLRVEQSERRSFPFKVHARSKLSTGFANVVAKLNKRTRAAEAAAAEAAGPIQVFPA